ncbi:hypothetical protein JI739_18670 [Ramlibacter sp. AW1]|uniref:Uncharacterized protein n=1 Tax=Ramlibacter aurantiacus TaxID=2801330 RepID=A0A936ZJ76_9BURK|nr:hypothetical protein [Ramlibacter aurantiacus]MBL0422379.1 hypothetical protein [Ramlibacter aurantiacus]
MTFTSNNPAETLDRSAPVASTAPSWSKLALAQIKLQKHPTRGSGLSNGRYWLSEALLRRAWELFWRNSQYLQRDAIYDTPGLAAPPDWDNWKRGDRIAIGMCFKYFAVHGVLPITLLNPEKTCNFKYRLSDDLARAPASLH